MTEYSDVPTNITHVFTIEGKGISPESRYWFACHPSQCRTLLANGKPVAIFGVGVDPASGRGSAMMIVSDDIEKHGMALYRSAKNATSLMDRVGTLWALVDCNNKRAMRFAERFGFEADHVVYRRRPHVST